MLRRLEIENFILIETLALDLGPGIVAITGETGTGKSVLLDAIAAAVGGRIGTDAVRTGADRAKIEATFEVGTPVWLARWREAHGVDPLEIGAVVVSREISAKGSRCRVDGQLVTLAALRGLGRLLIGICGQHDHMVLAGASEQLAALDAFGGLKAFQADVAQAHEVAKDAARALAEARETAQARLREQDFWIFQAGDIDALGGFEDDEAERLEAEARILRQASSLSEAAEASRQMLQDEVADSLGRAALKVRSAAATDGRLVPIGEALDGAAIMVDEAVRDLRRYSESIDQRSERLGDVGARRHALGSVMRKYGATLEAVRHHRERLAADLAAVQEDGDRVLRLQVAAKGAAEALVASADLLTARRLDAAKRLEMALARELPEVGLGQARVDIHLVRRGASDERPGPEGWETIEFGFAPNPGEPPRALGKIASGGELSRLMLALQVAMLDLWSVPTLVFDEVDAGISGDAARTVARKLGTLGKLHQLLLVTHLPAIAAVADRHWRLEKIVSGGRTLLAARELSRSERVTELAHLLTGGGGTPAAAGAAEDLLAGVQGAKGSPKRRGIWP